MKPENWTDYEHPCFFDYYETAGVGDGPEDCDSCSDDCNWLHAGHTWRDCTDGALSKHCDWLPKGEKDD